MPSSLGYSGSPLEKKLGFKEDHDILLVNPPSNYLDFFHHIPDSIRFHKNFKPSMDIVHVFVSWRRELDLIPLKKLIKQNGMIWVSWPKKASREPSDMDENYIRDMALSMGLVDVKVCSVNEKWSGLKLVIPVKFRK